MNNDIVKELMSLKDTKNKVKSLPSINNYTIIKKLNETHASLISLCIKTSGFTYNVVSSDFYEYHSFFNLTIEYLHKQAYDIAERVRSLGGMANYSLKDIVEKSNIPEEKEEITAPDKMVKSLLSDYETLSDMVRTIFKLAGEYADSGTIALVTNMAMKLEHFAWELRVMGGAK